MARRWVSRWAISSHWSNSSRAITLLATGVLRHDDPFLHPASALPQHVDFSNEALQAAEKGLSRLMEAYGHLMKLKPSATSTVDTKGLREKCFEAMNDDLNSPIVISHLFDAARAINSVKDGKATLSEEDLKELQEVFHLFLFDILGMKDEASAGGSNYETFSKAVDLLLSIRQQAKANKDWATSDKIRNELTAMGFEIKDTKDGAEWKLS